MVDLRVPTDPQCKPRSTFRSELCPRVAPALLVCDRKLRDVAVSRAGLRQVAACTLYLWDQNQSTRVRGEL